MKKILGIELGSTRIKSVLIDENTAVVAQGSYEWENGLAGGLWSYPLETVDSGVRESFANLLKDYEGKFGERLTEIDAIGVSAMMHGYMAFDENFAILTPFRTWRNTNTEEASEKLSRLFSFNIPMRWSVSHYYQAILNGEEHVNKVDFLTTLAGYVHYKLTGKRVLGIGDASGMFPVSGRCYDKQMLESFNRLLLKHGITRKFESVLPEILLAGEHAGTLTEEGALWLCPAGNLSAGIPLSAPEGDAGTGMVATNCIKKKSANVSAGTSAFLMAVLEKKPDSYYPEIDIVKTPAGDDVAMVHVNSFASEITSWANLFEEVAGEFCKNVSRDRLFDFLYQKSLEADCDFGDIIGYNFLAGEPIAKLKTGMPLIMRAPGGKLNLANFMKMHVYSALATLSMGCDILSAEKVKIDTVCAHGGFFKSEYVGQSAMSAAIGAPVSVMKNAGEGGAWGVALLALYTLVKKSSLEEFLDGIFQSAEKSTVSASNVEKESFKRFMVKYKAGLEVIRLASEIL